VWKAGGQHVCPCKNDFWCQKFRTKSGQSAQKIRSDVLRKEGLKKQNARFVGRFYHFGVAGPTGLEPATSGVTGRRSNQLNYSPAWLNAET
jgi:hypothetical protein